LISRSGDVLTLIGFAMAPSYGKGIGGINGIPYADMVLALAAIARGFQFLTEGVPRMGLRRLSVLLGILGLFCLSAMISGFANNDPLPLSFITIAIATVGSVLLIASYGDGESSTRPLLQAFTIGCVVLAVSAFLSSTRLEGRAFGWAIHPNQLGHSCVMGCAAAVWLYDNATSRLQRWCWAAAAAVSFLALMQSGSRGGLLGLWAGAMIYLCLRGRFRLILGAVAFTWAASLLLVTGTIELPASNPIERLFNEGTEDTGSNAARRDLLADNWRQINADPMFGAGFKDLWNIHVVYYQGWVGAGALGGFLVMGLGATMLVLPLWQRKRDLALACGLAAIAVAWLFTNILTPRDQWLFIAVAFGTTRLAKVRPLEPALDPLTGAGGER
jgi:hypothetical protein